MFVLVFSNASSKSSWHEIEILSPSSSLYKNLKF
jgi:hypothetical protein